MQKSFIEKSQIDKKLCIHCKHCSVYAGLGVKDRIMCGLYRDKVDDSELYTAFYSRLNPLKCGGSKWEISPDIVICQSKEDAESFQSEDWIESFLPLARKVVKGEVEKPLFTCGGYEKALERALKE
jgi:hypothetical protein